MARFLWSLPPAQVDAVELRAYVPEEQAVHDVLL